ncbi:MAG: hypothetical protein U5L96_07005 [Owenweeksia sp.]|nr:hypothetical protein [Owenweeksia sp.]
METKNITITKYSGEEAFFDAGKLRSSLQRSGAGQELIEQVVSEVVKILYPGITTKEIYERAFALLRKRSRPAAAKYNLKKHFMTWGLLDTPLKNLCQHYTRRRGSQHKQVNWYRAIAYSTRWM